MTGTYSVGVQSASGGRAYALYLLEKTLTHGREAAARYYAGEMPPLATTLAEELGQAVYRQELTFSEAADQLMGLELAAARLSGADYDIDTIQERVHKQLADAATAADFAAVRGDPVGPDTELRRDLSAAFAERLGIDQSRPLTVSEIANLMNNQRADGGEIEGRKKHSAHRSVADVFGLDATVQPTVEQIEHVLAGRRADGEAPREADGNGAPLADKVVASSLRKFKAAIGVPTDRDASPDEIARVADGRIDVWSYRKQISATSPPIAFVDLTLSADKSVSLAHALAPTEAERAIWLSIVQDAGNQALAYAEDVLGVARRGAQGSGEAESAELAWIRFQHYSARPAVDVVRLDAEGREFTDPRNVPVATADPHLHQHTVILSSMLSETGRISAVDLSRLAGEVKVVGAVFHAAIATGARRHGIEMAMGPSGEARVVSVPDWARKFSSRRSLQGEEAARTFARERGKDWDALTGDERVALLHQGAAATRRDKLLPDESRSDFTVWQQDAEAAGYQHRSTLRPDAIQPALTDEQRLDVAHKTAERLMDEAFKTRAVLTEGDLREYSARGLIEGGLGERASDDIAAVMRGFHDRGVTIGGVATRLVWGMERGEDGRQRAVVTTAHTIAQERDLVLGVHAMRADRSASLTREQIDQAASRVLARNPRIDPDGAQWKAQKAMAHQIGADGRFSLSIGVAGSGKTSSVGAVLVDAWHAEGKTVFGMTVPWRAAGFLKEAGVDHAVAIEAFIRRVEKGTIKPDHNSVILADEVSMIGVRQQLALVRIARETGAQLIEIGDPRQCQAVETPAIDLLAKAIGDASIPKLLTSIRQKTERGQEIATMFREGRAVEGVKALGEDGHLHLVAGGPARVVQRTVALWREITDANAHDPDHTLVVMAPSNAHARTIGMAIRANRREAGEIAATDGAALKAVDPNSKETFDLPVAVGDKLRMFTRTFDSETRGRRKHLSSNGDVVELREVRSDGLRIRNAEGAEGLVTWAQMKPWRAPKSDPIRLTYGYAVTVDASQAMTASDSILAMPEGSAQVTGFKAYTAGTRHEQAHHLVVSDAAERAQIVKRQRIDGHPQVPSQEDVLRNLAGNLGRFETKRTATEMVSRAISKAREAVADFQQGMEPIARQQQTREMRVRSYTLERAAPAMEQVRELKRGMEAVQAMEKRRERVQAREYDGPRMSM